MFNREDLILIRQVFGQANFPGNSAVRIAMFIQKVEAILMEMDRPVIEKPKEDVNDEVP